MPCVSKAYENHVALGRGGESRTGGQTASLCAAGDGDGCLQRDRSASRGPRCLCGIHHWPGVHAGHAASHMHGQVPWLHSTKCCHCLCVPRLDRTPRHHRVKLGFLLQALCAATAKASHLPASCLAGRLGVRAANSCTTADVQGELPDNMKQFWRFLLRKSLPASSLAGLTYAVFGLGDSGARKAAAEVLHLHC